jgi:glycine betaine/proline transport system substrate-binding protein
MGTRSEVMSSFVASVVAWASPAKLRRKRTMLKSTFSEDSRIKGLLTAVCAGALLTAGMATASAQEQPGEGVTVQPAVATWTSGIPKSWVYVELLEELGYNVQAPVALSNPVAYLAISEGDVHYWPNGWFPLHDPQLPDGFGDVATIFDPLCPACGIQGYLVDTASVEAYEITGIEDFHDEEIRAAFDANGDGRADLFGCPPGWGCHEGINAMIEQFDLGDIINHVDAGYAANFAEVLSRVEAGEPVLYYTWGPSAWLLELVPGEQVMWVNAPGIVEDDAERAEGVEGAVSDPIEMGFVAADIQVVANNAFLEENPAAAALFEQVELPLAWISEVDAAMEEQGLSDEEVRPLVREWIEENRDTVDEWLDAARAAAG